METEGRKRRDIWFVETIKEKCRMCYTCVRECPAKAIRIAEGQAEIIRERCIGCGNCVRVCSQNAKVIRNTVGEVTALLKSGARVSACLAPSFPAAFPDFEWRRIVGSVRAAGFQLVHEVAFGADLIAAAYREFLEKNAADSYIGTTCPALVNYIECYHPELIPNLEPIVSPMTATAAALKTLYGTDLKIVFIGPCLAKKGEDPGNSSLGAVDAVITFRELAQLFESLGLDPSSAEPSETDPPYANMGMLFPVSGGILQAADIMEDLVSGGVVSVDGRRTFVETIREFAVGDMDVRLLEILCCNGCIMGSGMACDASLFRRRGIISQYVRERMACLDKERWEDTMASLTGLDLGRSFYPNDQRMPVPSKSDLEKILLDLGKIKPEDELNCGACGYETCIEHATAIFQELAENEMCLPNTIEQLNKAIQDLAVSNDQLAKTQEALLQSEKLASMGHLAAGIAHELNNPLGVLLMYAHLLLMEQEGNEDLKMITEQAERCRKIVSGLLHFARQNKVIRQPVYFRHIVDKALHLVSIPENVTVGLDAAMEDPIVEVDEDQIIQVLTNLITNAVAAMPEGGRIRIVSRADGNNVEFRISDTGTGISGENLPRIFQPFFTTKEFGKGTGLGLSVSHGIIKMHSGDIRVESNADPLKGPTGSEFIVTIPRREHIPDRVPGAALSKGGTG